MSGPLMNRKLVLEAPLRSPDGAGGFAISWTALGTVWGAIRPMSGREVSAVGGTMSKVPVKISVRAAPVGSDLRPEVDQRFREGGRAYVITAVKDDDPMRRVLTCHAVEEVMA